MNMLSFYAVRGIAPDYILSLHPLERRFYFESMSLYYKELKEILKVMGGVRIG